MQNEEKQNQQTEPGARELLLDVGALSPTDCTWCYGTGGDASGWSTCTLCDGTGQEMEQTPPTLFERCLIAAAFHMVRALAWVLS